MKVNQFEMDNVTVLRPGERLDSNSSEGFEEVIEQTIEAGKVKIVLDLEEVPFMSSQGLRVILTGVKVAKAAGGKLVVCSSPEAVTKVFDITGVRRLMGVFPSRQDAVNSFSESGEDGGES